MLNHMRPSTKFLNKFASERGTDKNRLTDPLKHVDLDKLQKVADVASLVYPPARAASTALMAARNGKMLLEAGSDKATDIWKKSGFQNNQNILDQKERLKKLEEANIQGNFDLQYYGMMSQ